jgi:hypothetical protein
MSALHRNTSLIQTFDQQAFKVVTLRAKGGNRHGIFVSSNERVARVSRLVDYLALTDSAVE